MGNSTGAVGGHTPDDAVSALAAVPAVSISAATVARGGTAVSGCPVSAHGTTVVGSACSIGGIRGRVATTGVIDAEVDRPYHGTAKTKVVSPGLLQRDRLFVIVTDPLVSPSNLLHLRIQEQCWREILLGDQVLDLASGHNACKVGTRGGLARTTERASEGVAARVGKSVSATVVRHAKVDLGKIKPVEPKSRNV